MKRIFNILSSTYWRYFKGPEAYARYIGVKIGKNCLINTRNWSSEPYLIQIGDNVAITKNVCIHTHGGARVARRHYPDFDIFGKVIINDWAYIGTGAQIMPGVTIGEGAMIAAGSIVTKSVPPGTVYGGNPARFICTVEDYIEKNLKYNVGTKPLTSEEKKTFLLGLPDDKFIKK